MERVFTFRKLLIILLKKLNLILLCALIIGMLAGIYAVYVNYRNAKAQENAASTLTEKMEQYEAELTMAKLNLEQTESSLEYYEEYFKESIYYHLDSNNSIEYNILFCVNTGYQSDLSPQSQDKDKAIDIIKAYTQTYRLNGIIATGIRDLLGCTAADKYIYELISITPVDGNSISMNSSVAIIRAVYSDAETASKMAHCTFDSITKQMEGLIAPHTVTIVSEGLSYKINTELIEIQKIRMNDYQKAKQAVADKQEILNNLYKQAPQITVTSKTNMLLRVVRYGMVGIALGTLFGALIAFLIAIMNNKINDVVEAKQRYKFLLLGVICKNNKNQRWLDRCVYRLNMVYTETRTRIENLRIIAANIDAVANEKNQILFVGTGDQSLAQDLSTEISGIIHRPIIVGENVLEDIEVIEKLKEIDSAVIVISCGVSDIEHIDAEISKLEFMNKKILGMVVVL